MRRLQKYVREIVFKTYSNITEKKQIDSSPNVGNVEVLMWVL